MLESLRSGAQSWIARLLLGGIILSFALWGIADYFLAEKLPKVAEVDGEPITGRAFVEAYERQLASLRAVMGGKFSREEARKLGLAEQTLQTLINRAVLRAEAERLGLAVPDVAIAAAVHADPRFQSAGHFDPGQYRLAVRALGYATPTDFENALKTDLLINQIEALMQRSAWVGEKELQAALREAYEKRVFAAVVFDPETMPAPKIAPEEARRWYEEHKADYTAPAKVRLAWVEIDPAKIAEALEPSDEDLKRLYEEQKARFTEPEARHIQDWFIEAKDPIAKKAARATLEKALAAIKSGKRSFKDAAGKSLVDLGWVKKGEIDPAIEKAAWSLAPGEVSEVIEGASGLHLIRVVEARPARLRPFKEVKDELVRLWRETQAADEAADLADRLDDALGRLDQLAEAAKEVGIAAQTLGPVPVKEAMLDPRFADAALRRVIAQAQPGDPIEIAQTEDPRSVAVEILERIPPKPLPYDAVADRVIADLAAHKRHEAARARAQEALANAKGRAADEVAKEQGAAFYESSPVRRSGEGARAAWLVPAVLDKGFAAAEGAWIPEVVDTPLGPAIVQVRKVHAPSEEELAAHRDEMKKDLLRSEGAARFARWLAAARARHEIEIHDEVLAQLAR